MSMYPNSAHAEPIDVKPAAAADGATQTMPGSASGGATTPGPTPTPDAPAGQLSEDETERDSFTPDPESSVPEAIQKLRHGTIYDADGTYRHAIVMKNDELPAEQLDSANTELRRMAGDLGLSNPQAADFAWIAKSNSERPPSDEQQEAWHSESMTALQRQYGNEAESRLNLARTLVQRDPRLAGVLDAFGLGNHPRVVATLVERAQAERKAGRL